MGFHANMIIKCLVKEMRIRLRVKENWETNPFMPTNAVSLKMDNTDFFK